MAYVLKNDQGNIIASSPDIQPDTNWVEIDNDAPEYTHFLEHSLENVSAFRESDIQLVRVLEDLITVLIDKDVIRFTDLPGPAQQRLNKRESMRKKTSLSGLMHDKDDFIF